MGLWRYLAFCLVFFIFLAVYIVQSTVQHEYIHQLIFQKYDIDSNVTYNFKNAALAQWDEFIEFRILQHDINDSVPWAWVTPIYTNSSGNCTETCHSLHTQQEIVDSGVSNIIMMMFVMLFLYVTYKEFFSRNLAKEIRHMVRDEIEDQEVEIEQDVPSESRFNFELSK